MCRSTIPALKNRPRAKVEKSVQHHVYETNNPRLKLDVRVIVRHRTSMAMCMQNFNSSLMYLGTPITRRDWEETSSCVQVMHQLSLCLCRAGVV